jgi:hypothetical protein
MNDSLKNYFAESDVLKKLNLTGEELEHLRQRKEFPYVRINKKKRAYDERDVALWLAKHKENATWILHRGTGKNKQI